MMKVKDVMTSSVISIDAKENLENALNIMKERNIRRLPVIRNGRLAGIIVKYDIEKSLRMPGIIPQTPVEWVMSREVFVVGPDDDVVAAARIINEKHVTGLPVLEGDEMIGIISDADIIRLFIKMMESKD